MLEKSPCGLKWLRRVFGEGHALNNESVMKIPTIVSGHVSPECVSRCPIMVLSQIPSVSSGVCFLFYKMPVLTLPCPTGMLG